jgi:hypothetical protein
MRGSSIGDFSSVSRISLIEQAKSVLNAGGAVYLGEDHTEKDGRNICIEVLAGRCVQYLCVEFDTEVQGLKPEEIDQVERVLGHKPPVKMSAVMNACINAGGQVVHVDDQQKKPKARQKFIRGQVAKCRKKVDRVGRGVLVLIGSHHLINTNGWHALHEIVYDGLSFVYGQCGSCTMVWQLS